MTARSGQQVQDALLGLLDLHDAVSRWDVERASTVLERLDPEPLVDFDVPPDTPDAWRDSDPYPDVITWRLVREGVIAALGGPRINGWTWLMAMSRIGDWVVRHAAREVRR
ncbi:hypothetical protein [Tepidiforma bonchosmolovskayae]|uniref:hypothetical protein n=1 Tax=Tepidiforma bonchosmolovskayae TaxID=2601677 RepID=UPI001787F45E|nr:hypothetical protein [Tepidiforma bonchosmolovskayae]